MDYTFKFNQTPYNSVIDMIRWSRERQDARNKERNDNYSKLMQMLGRGVAAYKMNKDLADWKANQEYWNDESDMLDMISGGYYDPDDFDIDSMLSINPEGYVNAKREENPYWVPGDDDATQTDYALWQLGLK